MTIQALLDELVTRGIKVRLDGEQLLIEAPKGSLTAELQDSLRSNKPALIAALKRSARGQDAAGDVTRAEPDLANRHEPFPLTDIQQAYWIGRTAGVELGGVGCHYYQELESGDLELERLESSFNALIVHHDMLRAVVGADGQQRILEDVGPYRFGVSDVRTVPAGERDAELAAVRERMSHHVFPADQWPLFEIHVAQLPEDRLRVYVSFDLLMVDAFSLSALIRDWRRFYHDDDPPAPVELSFRDYVLALEQSHETPRYQEQLAYWDDRIATLPGAPELPGPTSPAPEDAIARRNRRKGRLDRDRWQRLQRRAHEHTVTTSALLCAVFAEALGAWSSAGDFTINLTACARQPVHPQVDALVGDFTSTVLLEVDRQPETFLARARALQARLSADMDHGEVSGVEVLRRHRRLGGGMARSVMPIVFTSLIGHGEDHTAPLFCSNWLGELVYGVSQTPQVSLDYQAFEDHGDLVYHWDTVQGEFHEDALEAMFLAYGHLLQRLADDDGLWSAAALSLVPEDQLAARAAVNATEQTLPGGLLYAGFDRQVVREPGALAVISGEQRLTYQAIDERATPLAATLREHGITAGEVIAVVARKGWEQVVAVLAVLKAGGAYLPIDASLPEARIHHLLRHAEVRVALTQSQVAGDLSWPDGVRQIAVDQVSPAASPDSAGAELAAASSHPGRPGHPGPDALAYTIFTSGSTGQPKGVMINHSGPVNTISDINQRFGVGPQDRVLGLSSLDFDLSVYDVFGTLAAGAALVLPDPAARRDPGRWAELVTREGITIWNSVPALMRLLVEYAEPAGVVLPTLRLVMLSGDWIPVTLPDRIREVAPNAHVISMGGATEASIWSIMHEIAEVDLDRPSIPYGKPMANQSWHVLDDRLQPCPDLVPGELFIGGVGLAMGYWRNDDETNHRFIRHPETGERLYRTGDLGRYHPGGEIEILGRTDLQVKVQGYRIELGEIETVLEKHPDISGAVVVTREDGEGQKHLVAYVVPERDDADRGANGSNGANGANGSGGVQSISGDALDGWREHLAAQVPSYMVPTVFVALDALPLSKNGKIDRARLPEPQLAVRAATEHTAPSNDVERAVVETVAGVLELDPVGIDDGFVALGATSVHMVRIFNQLSKVVKHDLVVADMFNHATLRSLAGALSHSTTASDAERRSAVKDRAAQRRSHSARRRQRR